MYHPCNCPLCAGHGPDEDLPDPLSIFDPDTVDRPDEPAQEEWLSEHYCPTCGLPWEVCGCPIF